MNVLLSDDQQLLIVRNFNHLLNCINGFHLNLSLLYILKYLKNLNSSSSSYIDHSFLNYFKSSYFTDGGVLTELFIPLLCRIHILIIVWITYKATTFYHVYYPLIKLYIDENERLLNEAQLNIRDGNEWNDGESTTEIGVQPLEEESDHNYAAEDLPVTVDGY
ncbi:unnamed protein product [Rotaria socialis]|uniref:Uncharacterized protein n=1 Tax=Rotaria socialis TaxID=392032 RepID=A0A817UQN0_9BILA|nr:unnamed protein product [Rotaria socialis]